MIQTLIQSTKFNGKYVALKNFKDHTVIAEGTSPKEVQDAAFQKGCKDPLITFIPTKDMVQIY